MTKNYRKGLIALILVLAMFLNLVPVSAFALDASAEMNTYTFESDQKANPSEALYTATVQTAETLETGTLAYSNNTDVDEVKELLAQKFDGTLQPSIFNFSLQNSEKDTITIPQDAKITLDFVYMHMMGDPLFFQYENGTVRELDVTKKASTLAATAAVMSHYIVDVTSLENIVLLPTNKGQVTPKRFSDLEEGRYYITANIFVKAEDNPILGIKAYMTNPAVPPTSPMTKNAIMEVDSTGKPTFTIDVANTVFSLQEINDGTDVHILSCDYGLDEGVTTSPYGDHGGRVKSIVCTVDNLSGAYTFGDCVEYPQPLKEDQTWPLQLEVDFSSAARILDGEGELITVSDENTGASLQAQTNDSALAEKLKNATFTTEIVAAGDVYTKAQEYLTAEYVDCPTFKLYTMSLTDIDGNVIPLDSRVSAVVDIPSDNVESDKAWFIGDKKVEDAITSSHEDAIRVEGITELQPIVLVDTATCTWRHKTLIDAATGMMLDAYVYKRELSSEKIGLSEGQFNTVDFVCSKQTEGTAIEAAQTYFSTKSDSTKTVSAQVLYDATPINSIYKSLMEAGGEHWELTENSQVYGCSWHSWTDKKDRFFRVILPTANDLDYYLLTNDGTTIVEKKLDSSIKDGQTVVELLPRDMTAEVGTKRLDALYWGYRGIEATAQKNTAHIVAVKTEKKANVTPVNPDKETTETVTANLFVPGELNKQLPGVTAYLTNGNNPNGEGGYEKKAPTEPVYDNAKLTTHSDGTRTLVLEVPNPVFTLQKLDGEPDGVSVSDTETTTCASAPKGTRISKVTIELPSTGDTFTFEDCEEYPTLLSTTWTVPLTLKLGKSGLDSKSDVDTGSVSGGTVAVKTDLTVKVKDDTATVSKINTDDLSSSSSITLDVTDGNKGVTGVNLPVSALEKIVDAKVPGTTLTLSDTSAKFDLAALTEVTKAASGKTIDLRILTGTDAEKKLSATEKSAMSDVKNASAVSVALSSDDKAITSVGSGKLTVSVPFKWDGKGAIRAYQVDANGKLVSVPVICKNNVAELTLTGTGNFILGTVDTKSFDDVADDAFYKTAVDWAVENGVTSGISDTLFAPAKTCTRAQVVTFLWRAAGSPEPTKTENPFTDVKSDAYYYKAVLWALEKGITSGTSATTFAPEAVVSRAQVVTFQWRMADSAKAAGTNNFTDVPADSYYKDAVQWAAEKGITSGTSATTFAPNAGCTRGQIVTFLYRQLGQ